MQSLIKLLVWMAPALLLVLMLVLSRMDRHDAKIDVETASFDRQFAQHEISLSDNNEDKEFWTKEKKFAEQHQSNALTKQVKAENKISSQTDRLEQVLKEMDKENKKWRK